jgi:hypothetical protein
MQSPAVPWAGAFRQGARPGRRRLAGGARATLARGSSEGDRIRLRGKGTGERGSSWRRPPGSKGWLPSARHHRSRKTARCAGRCRSVARPVRCVCCRSTASLARSNARTRPRTGTRTAKTVEAKCARTELLFDVLVVDEENLRLCRRIVALCGSDPTIAPDFERRGHPTKRSTSGAPMRRQLLYVAEASGRLNLATSATNLEDCRLFHQV